MTEFFLRFAFGKPLGSPPPFQKRSATYSVSLGDSTPQMEKPGALEAAEVILAGETAMSQEVKFMVIGLVVTTLLILIRCVGTSACGRGVGMSVLCG